MGRSSSQRARIAFCWLPPESSPIGWFSEARRMRSCLTESSASAFSTRAADDAGGRDLARDRGGDVLLDRQRAEDAGDGAILRDEGEAERDRLVRLADADAACR